MRLTEGSRRYRDLCAMVSRVVPIRRHDFLRAHRSSCLYASAARRPLSIENYKAYKINDLRCISIALIVVLGDMKPFQLKLLSNLCFILGFASIIGSIVIWYTTGGTDPASTAHAERFGTFVGLWAPTFFILSNRFDRYSEKIS